MDSEQKLFLPLLLVLAGCSHIPGLQKTTVASYEPSNVHREERHLPSQIKRVAVLPVTAMTDESAMEFGRDTLGPILV